MKIILKWVAVLALAGLAWKCPENGPPTPPPGPFPLKTHILDFGRGILDQSEDSKKFFREHVQCTESGDTGPNGCYFSYALAATACQHLDCDDASPLDAKLDLLPESYFLHVADRTTIRFSKFSQPAGQVIIDPCPGPPAKSCRLQSYVWSDRRWVFNPKTQGYRDWMALRLSKIAIDSKTQGVFLDEYGKGFAAMAGFWDGDAQIVSGGKVVEYGGRQIGDFEVDYNHDDAAALSAFRVRLKADGKFLFINTAAYSSDPLALELELAAGGVHIETLWRPDTFDDADESDTLLKALVRVRDTGGIVDLFGSTCYWGPAGYAKGNYSSSKSRYLMWRLAAYYLIAEGTGKPGHVFFDPTFCGADESGPVTPQSEWQKGYEFDLGEARGEYTRRGDLFVRDFTKAMVFVRAGGDLSDASAVNVGFPGPMKFLNGEGQLSSPLTTIRLRLGESAIAVKP